MVRRYEIDVYGDIKDLDAKDRSFGTLESACEELNRIEDLNAEILRAVASMRSMVFAISETGAFISKYAESQNRKEAKS